MIKFALVLLFIFTSLVSYDIKAEVCKFTKTNKEHSQTIACPNNEIKLLTYQNQVIELYKSVSDIGTENQILKLQINENEKYYKKILENQSKEFQVQLEQEQTNHDIVVDNLFIIFYITISLISMGILLLGFLLNFFGRREIKKMINKQIIGNLSNNVITEQVKKLKANPEFNKLIKDMISDSKVTGDDTVNDPL